MTSKQKACNSYATRMQSSYYGKKSISLWYNLNNH